MGNSMICGDKVNIADSLYYKASSNLKKNVNLLVKSKIRV